ERDHSGAVNVIVGLVENISERAALEQLREDLRAMLIHDLRQPLAIIHTALGLVAEESLEPAIQQIVRDALNNAQRQQTLIEAYLDVTRLEAGQMPFVLSAMSWSSVEQLAQKVLNTVQATARRRGLTVRLELPDPPGADWRIALDQSAIERVLLNLLDNAIKFSIHSQQPITMHLQFDATGLTIKVIDHGAGIPADKLPTIFDRFSQVRDGDRIRGTGLGLTFCKLAIEAHEGQITVESAEGQGSTFSVWLPLTESRDSPQTRRD
ncbi:MAG: HAMP domain-containing sensor histidine kinase, partial [Anaerolineae bacterium]